MRGKSIALLAVALGCGLVASLGITQVMAKRNADGTTMVEMQPVVVVARDVPYGVPLKSDLLKLEQWPKEKVPPGAIGRLEDVEGRRGVTRLYAGEPVLDAKLSKGDEPTVSKLIPKGWRVISVRVDSTHSGLILPGSHVDLQIFLTRNPANNIPETMVRTILHDVKVFAVNDVVNLEPGGPESKSIQARTVSLLVTPEQGELVTLANELGSIRLVMRGSDEDKTARSRGSSATPEQLLSAFGIGRRPPETPATAASGAKDSEADFLRFLKEKMMKKPGETAVAKPVQTADEPPKEKARTGEQWTMRVLAGPEVKDFDLLAANRRASDGSAFWKIQGDSKSAASPKPDKGDRPLPEVKKGPAPAPAADAKPAKEDPNKEDPKKDKSDPKDKKA